MVEASRAPRTAGGAGTMVLRPGSLAHPLPPAASLGELLREAPFVLIRQNSRGEQEISIRGSDSRQAAVLIEGIPVTLGWDSRVDPSLVPLAGVREVTTTRGLASLLDGPNVLGGVVEFGFLPQPGSTADYRELALATGIDQASAWSATGAVRFASRTSLGMLHFGGGLGQRRRDGVALGRPGATGGTDATGRPDPGRGGRGSLRTNSDLEERNSFTTIRMVGGTGRHIGLTLVGLTAQRGVPPEQHLLSPRRWRYPELSRSLVVLSTGTGLGRTPAGAGTLAASVGVQSGAVEVASYGDAQYTTITAREFGDERTVTGRVVATHSLAAHGMLRAGHTTAEIRYDERIDGEAPARYRQRLHSTGVEVEWAFRGGLEISGGLVSDRAETPESGGREALGRLSRAGWRIGASVLTRAGTIRWNASLHRRSRFPALRELYSGALDRFAPNPGLAPETLRGIEAGATIVGGPVAEAGFRAQAVVFDHRLHDAVVRVTLPDRRFQRINRDRIHSRGLELMTDWSSRPAAADGRARGVSLAADLLIQRVRVSDAALSGTAEGQRRAEHQPAVRGSIAVAIPLPLALRGTAGVRMMGRQVCEHPELSRQVELRSQMEGQMAVTRVWRTLGSRRARLVLAVDNVADAAVFDQCGLPVPGRTLRLAIELR